MSRAGIPVLCYHRISGRPLPQGTWVSPSALAAQLDALLARGVRLLTPQEYHERLDDPGPRDDVPEALVTFDDGTVDLHRHRTILDERGIRPLVFVPADYLGRRNRWEWPVPGRATRHLDAAQARELAAAGWEIGLHGARHVDLVPLPPDRLAGEIDEAKRRLEQALAFPVRSFSYPYGRCSDRVADRIEAAGFASAFVLAAGPRPAAAPDRFRLPRRPVYCIDSAADVVAKVLDALGTTRRGRWQHRKENAAHGVGRWAVRRFGGVSGAPAGADGPGRHQQGSQEPAGERDSQDGPDREGGNSRQEREPVDRRDQ